MTVETNARIKEMFIGKCKMEDDYALLSTLRVVEISVKATRLTQNCHPSPSGTMLYDVQSGWIPHIVGAIVLDSVRDTLGLTHLKPVAKPLVASSCVMHLGGPDSKSVSIERVPAY